MGSAKGNVTTNAVINDSNLNHVLVETLLDGRNSVRQVRGHGHDEPSLFKEFSDIGTITQLLEYWKMVRNAMKRLR